VPSPTCTNHNTSRQLQPRAPPATHNSQLKNIKKASLGHMSCLPSTTPRRCSTTHRNATAKHHVTSPRPLLSQQISQPQLHIVTSVAVRYLAVGAGSSCHQHDGKHGSRWNFRSELEPHPMAEVFRRCTQHTRCGKG
jgi:hypothetical protein